MLHAGFGCLETAGYKSTDPPNVPPELSKRKTVNQLPTASIVLGHTESHYLINLFVRAPKTRPNRSLSDIKSIKMNYPTVLFMIPTINSSHWPD